MTNDFNIELLNDDELIAVLRALPGKMGKNFVQSAWTKAAKPVKSAMIANLPEDTGTAKRSVTTVRGKSSKSPTVFVGPRQGGSKKATRDSNFLKSKGASNRQTKKIVQADAWYLRFLWRGTKYISPKKGLGGYEAAVDRALPSALKEFRGELNKVITRAWRRNK